MAPPRIVPPAGRITALPVYAALTVAAFLLATPAKAQSQCGDREQMLTILSTAYDESLVWVGTDPRGWTVELYQSPTGTFTILASQGTTACMVGAGENAQTVRPQPKGRGA